jgi:electron transport complex protein RnfG
MTVLNTSILRVGLMLAIFAIVATSLVAITEDNTRDKIVENEKQTLLAAINALVDSNVYNNDIITDVLILPKTKRLNTRENSIVYRARKDNQPIAAVFTTIAPNGYSGKIKLLIGVNYDGSLAGVRVISHKETPGLGDKIDLKKADWILQFNNLSLIDPIESKWKVKKDGGQFDQFTGATITPRAVVKAIKNALYFFEKNRDDLFKVVDE